MKDRLGLTAIGILVVAVVILLFNTKNGNSAPVVDPRPDTLNVIISIKDDGSVEEHIDKLWPSYHVVSGGVVASVAAGDHTMTTMRLVIGRAKVK